MQLSRKLSRPSSSVNILPRKRGACPLRSVGPKAYAQSCHFATSTDPSEQQDSNSQQSYPAIVAAVAAASTLQYYHAQRPTLSQRAKTGGIFRSTSGALRPSVPVTYPAASSTAALTSTAPSRVYPSAAKAFEGRKIVVYQYKICPFCCKCKAVLDLFQVPYSTLEVNPLMKTEIHFSKDYRKVPIVKIGDEVVKDSPVIVQKIVETIREAGVVPKEQLDHFVSPQAQQWAEWADKKLAVLLFPNITRTFKESFEAFGYVEDVPHFGFIDKLSNHWVGSTAMWAAQGKLKKKYNIEDERTALSTALSEWMKEVGDKAFSGGAKPNYGDVCVYAAIRAIEGLTAQRDILSRHQDVEAWYHRVAEVIGETSCVKAD